MNNTLATTTATGPLQLSGLNEVLALGEVLAKSGMFESARTAAQAVVKILAGRELGFAPVASLTGIHFFDGKPNIGAHLLVSLIKRSGKYDLKLIRCDRSECELECLRLVDGKWVPVDGDPRIKMTIQEAVKNPDGSPGIAISKDGKTLKANWRNHSDDMLFARCASKAYRRHFADLTGGVTVYTTEEMEGEPALREVGPVQDAGYTIHRQDGSSVIVSDDSRPPVEIPAPEGNGHVPAPPAGGPDPNVPSPAPARGPEHGLTEEEVAGLTILAREHRRTHGDVKAILSAVGCLTLGAIPRDRLEWVKQALTVGLTPAAVVDRIAALVTQLNLNWEAFRSRLQVKHRVSSIAHLLPSEAAEIEQTLLSRQKLAQQQSAPAA